MPGLGCRATDARAIRAIFSLKGRERGKPLILFVPGLAAASRFVVLTPRVRRLLAACWPGAFTAVLRARRRLPAGLGARGRIGVRVPAHRLALALLRRVGPLATSSANRSGRPPVRDAARAGALWPGRVVAVPGRAVGAPSVVADCTVWPPRVIRAGGLPPAVLARRVRAAEKRGK